MALTTEKNLESEASKEIKNNLDKEGKRLRKTVKDHNADMKKSRLIKDFG